MLISWASPDFLALGSVTLADPVNSYHALLHNALLSHKVKT